MGRFAEFLGALLASGAGVYLLLHNSEPLTIGGVTGESWLAVIAHGMGAYFLARGLWMFGRLGQQYDATRSLEELVDIARASNPVGEDTDERWPAATG